MFKLHTVNITLKNLFSESSYRCLLRKFKTFLKAYKELPSGAICNLCKSESCAFRSKKVTHNFPFEDVLGYVNG